MDKTLAEQVIEFINENKGIPRIGIAKHFKISRYAVDQLAIKGLVPNMPKPMNTKQSASYGRATGGIKWGDNFRLRGTPNFGGSKCIN